MPARIGAGASQAKRYMTDLGARITIEYAAPSGFDAYRDRTYAAATQVSVVGFEEVMERPGLARTQHGEEAMLDAHLHVLTADWDDLIAAFDPDSRLPEAVMASGRRYTIFTWTAQQNGTTTLWATKHRDSL